MEMVHVFAVRSVTLSYLDKHMIHNPYSGESYATLFLFSPRFDWTSNSHKNVHFQSTLRKVVCKLYFRRGSPNEPFLNEPYPKISPKIVHFQST